MIFPTSAVESARLKLSGEKLPATLKLPLTVALPESESEEPLMTPNVEVPVTESVPPTV